MAEGIETQHLVLATEYLTSHGYTLPERLSGGTGNFLLRGRSIAEPGKTAIVKHAAPFVASLPSIPFPVVRMSFEVQALQMLRDRIGLLSPDADADAAKQARQPPLTVSIPELYTYDESLHCILMEDCGSLTLKAIYPTLSPFPHQRATCGACLGSWLAALHQVPIITAGSATSSVPKGNPLPGSALDSPTAKAMSRFATYGRLAATAKQRSNDNDSIAFWTRIDAEYGNALIDDNAVICHGDFWPGNVLVRNVGVSGSGYDGDDDRLDLTVVDWELVRLGSGATDVGQFAAEAWLLGHFHGDRKPDPNSKEDRDQVLLESFLRAYRASLVTSSTSKRGRSDDFASDSILTDRWLQKTLVHFGVHLWFWTTVVGWGTEAEMQEVVNYGEEVVRVAISGGLDEWRETTVGRCLMD